MEAASERTKLLILDDQLAYVRSLERVLRADYDVFGVTSIAEAEKAALPETFAALVDIRLDEKEPGNRDGLKFIGWLHEQHPAIVPIAMSALEDPDLEGEAVASGAAMFLQKPVRVSELKEILRKLLRERS